MGKGCLNYLSNHLNTAKDALAKKNFKLMNPANRSNSFRIIEKVWGESWRVMGRVGQGKFPIPIVYYPLTLTYASKYLRRCFCSIVNEVKELYPSRSFSDSSICSFKYAIIS